MPSGKSVLIFEPDLMGGCSASPPCTSLTDIMLAEEVAGCGVASFLVELEMLRTVIEAGAEAWKGIRAAVGLTVMESH